MLNSVAANLQKNKKNNDFKLNSKKTMKTKAILMISALFLLTCCKKKECIFWLYPESEGITISKTDYNKASDVGKKFAVDYSSNACDDSKLIELLDMDGDTLKVFGMLTEDYPGGVRLYNPGEDGSVHISGNMMDSLQLDSQIYYVTGILHLKCFSTYDNFKTRINKYGNTDSCVLISLYPLSYYVKQI